mgnify:CR=1 FL=1
MRPSGRAPDQLREISLETDFSKHAEGSCLARFGDTHVLCTASIDEGVPGWLRNSGRGWITAEDGRSLRPVADRKGFGERQIRLDCDVIQADGGTRTAAITGSYVALHLAFQHMQRLGAVERIPLVDSVAAVSCGLYQGAAVLDLDYAEDSNAEADANFVLTGNGGLVEVQATAEADPFSQEQFDALFALARKGVGELVAAQKAALGLS